MVGASVVEVRGAVAAMAVEREVEGERKREVVAQGLAPGLCGAAF